MTSESPYSASVATPHFAIAGLLGGNQEDVLRAPSVKKWKSGAGALNFNELGLNLDELINENGSGSSSTGLQQGVVAEVASGGTSGAVKERKRELEKKEVEKKKKDGVKKEGERRSDIMVILSFSPTHANIRIAACACDVMAIWVLRMLPFIHVSIKATA